MDVITIDTSRLDRFLAAVRKELPARLQRGCLRRVLTVYARAIRRQTTAADASTRAKRAARATVGVKVQKHVAKVGFALRPVKDKEKGITQKNVHWLVLGVPERRTRKGERRGAVPAFFQGVVKRAAAEAPTQAVRYARRWLVKQIRQMKG